MEGLNSDKDRWSKYTGRTFEFDMLGGIDIGDQRYRKLLAELSRSDGSGYLDRNRAIELARECQSGDPENPDKPFLKDLLCAVQDQLDEAGIETKVRAYTAVGTPLDHLHGVDAFLSATVGEREYVCTIDVTRNPDKLSSGHKADLIVGELPDPTDGKEEEDSYLDGVEKIGNRATVKLLEQINKGQKKIKN